MDCRKEERQKTSAHCHIACPSTPPLLQQRRTVLYNQLRSLPWCRGCSTDGIEEVMALGYPDTTTQQALAGSQNTATVSRDGQGVALLVFK